MAEKEDKCDGLAATLHLQEELVSTLTSEKAKAEKEASARTANLNQALMQSKHSCSQLSEQLETHKAKEWELAQQVEDLQLAAATVASSSSSSQDSHRAVPCRACREREGLAISGTPVRSSCGGGGRRLIQSSPAPFAPTGAVESELDSLRTENKKLKQDLSCLQANFQLTTQKTAQLRSEMKEAESTLADLRGQFDTTLAEKEELQARCEALLETQTNSQATSAKEARKAAELAEDAEKLREGMDNLQRQNAELQAQLADGLSRTAHSQDMMERLDSVKKSLGEEKSAMTVEMEGLRETLEGLQGKCQELESSDNAHREEKRRAAATIKSLKAKVVKLGHERAELSEQLTKASEKLEQAQDKIHLHMEEAKALEVNLRAKERENVLLSSEKKEQAHVPVELENLRQKIVETLEEMGQLRAENDAHLSARDRLEGKVSELSKANAKLMRESRRASELSVRVNIELERMEEKAQELEADLQAERERHGLTKKRLAEATSELTGVANTGSQHKTETRELSEKLRHAEEQISELMTELAGWKGEADKLRRHRSDAQHKLAETEGKLDAAEFALLEKESLLSDLKCSCDLMEAENSTLLSQVTSLSEMVSTRNFKLEAQQAHYVQHESEFLEIAANVAHLEAEHSSCADIIRKLQDGNETLKGSLEREESQRRETEGEVSRLKAVVKELESSVAALKGQNANLQQRVALQDDRMGEIGQARDATEARAQQLERDLKAERLALMNAQNELRHAERTLEESRRERADVVGTLESRLADVELRETTSHKERVELRSRVAELKTELKEQTLLCSSLKIQRDSLSEQYECLKESALSVLQSDSSPADAEPTLGVENPPSPLPSTSPKGKGRAKAEPKGILRKATRSRKALQPVQNF